VLLYFSDRIYEAKSHLNQPFILSYNLEFSLVLLCNIAALILQELMSGLYNQISSPSTARASSPNINMRSSFDVERYMN